MLGWVVRYVDWHSSITFPREIAKKWGVIFSATMNVGISATALSTF